MGLALLILAAVACHKTEPQAGQDPPKAQPFGELTVDQVAQKVGQPGVFVYDNNRQDEWQEGHVPTAKWVDYKKVTASDLPPDKDATLVFYCHNEH